MTSLTLSLWALPRCPHALVRGLAKTSLALHYRVTLDAERIHTHLMLRTMFYDDDIKDLDGILGDDEPVEDEDEETEDDEVSEDEEEETF